MQDDKGWSTNINRGMYWNFEGRPVVICEDVNWRLLQALQNMKKIMDDRAILMMGLAEMGMGWLQHRGVFLY